MLRCRARSQARRQAGEVAGVFEQGLVSAGADGFEDRPHGGFGLGHAGGTPLEKENRGGFVEVGTLVCLVSRPGSIEAVAIFERLARELA